MYIIQIHFRYKNTFQNCPRKQIQKESQGAKVLGITYRRISNIDVIYTTEGEQQKISDCL